MCVGFGEKRRQDVIGLVLWVLWAQRSMSNVTSLERAGTPRLTLA